MPIGIAGKAIRSGGFRPDQISSLENWYDATKLSGFSDGNSVGTWSDEEGSNDLTQGTGSKQPTYKTNIIGGNPIIRFDGSDDLMDTAFSTLSQPNQIFAVWQFSASTISSDEFFFDSEDGSTNRNAAFARASGDDWSMFAGTTITGGSLDTSPHIFNFLFNGANSTGRQDATQIMSGDAGSQGLSGLTVGARHADDTYGDVDLGEVLVYDAELSSSDRDDVESYLSVKWGITI